mmetsp:Transcript_30114/g.51261  ORF Transcript_30114/g.51261 Transcript_30114/m.51261 type:complete len:523 (-) Transcript_30114:120-1688(-)
MTRMHIPKTTNFVTDSSKCTARALYRKERRLSEDSHRSRRRARKGNMLSNSVKLLSLSHRHTRVKKEQDCNPQDGDSVSVTLGTVSCTSDNSSCFNAEENKNVPDSDKRTGAVGWTRGEYDSNDSKHDDGYDTDHAVICDTTSVCNRKEDAPGRQLRRRQKEEQVVQKSRQEAKLIADRIIHEQSMAMEAWDEVAVEYSRRIEPFTSLFVPHLLDRQYLSSNNEYHYLSGKTVLDVAAGTGAAAIYAASSGASSVMATDFSKSMLKIIQRRIDSIPFHNAKTQIANGLCLPLEWANKYDIAFSNFGVIYFPKVKEGLWEMVRCTRPGGQVCVSAWGSNEETQAFSIFPSAIKMCGLHRTWYSYQSTARKHLLDLAGIKPCLSRTQHQTRKYPGISVNPNYFCPAKRISTSQYSLHSMMDQAGLVDITVIPVTKDLRLGSIESYWNRFVLASPNLKRFVNNCLTPQEVIQLKDAVSKLLDQESSCHRANGIALKASAYIAIGTKALVRQKRKYRSSKKDHVPA